jgi:general stress protein 26
MAKTLADIAEKMRDVDFCMLTTHTHDGAIAARPMSTNRDVEYDGDSWFFTSEDADMVGEIERNPQVAITFQDKSGLFGTRPFFATIEAHATLIRDRSQFAAHWSSGLERYFPQGPETPGVVLIKARADIVHYWDGDEEGRIQLSGVTA